MVQQTTVLEEIYITITYKIEFQTFLFSNEVMMKLALDDYVKSTKFQMFLSNAGFGSSSAGYKALAGKGIKTMADFLPMEVKLFSKDNLNKDGLEKLTIGEALKLQTLLMWVYCKHSTHGDSELINWKITQGELSK